MITVVATCCPFCGKIDFIEVDTEGYLAWQEGELIQNALPTLSADKREMLKTGICPACWDNMFGSKEEKDEEPEEFDYDFMDTYLEQGFNPYSGCYDWDC